MNTRNWLLRQGRYVPGPFKRALGGCFNYIRTKQADKGYQPTYIPSKISLDGPDHIIVVVIDALRSDRVRDDIAPFLNSLSGGDAISPSPWTFPSVSAVATGLYPHQNGVIRQHDDPKGDRDRFTLPPGLDDSQNTIYEIAGGLGYETYGAFAFDMPFMALSTCFEKHVLYRSPRADDIFEDHKSWLNNRESSRTFSYLHLSDIHSPVLPVEYARQRGIDPALDGIFGWRYEDVPQPSGEAAEYVEHRNRMYDACLEYVDEVLSLQYNQLKDMLNGEVQLIVYGDHGEGLWDNAAFDAEHFYDSRPAYSVGHGGTPYECVARVPLLFDGPVTPSWSGYLSLIDLFPTLTGSFGVEEEFETAGIQIRDGQCKERIVLSESTRYGYEKKAVYYGKWKLIESRGDGELVGFSLPDETVVELPTEVKRRLKRDKQKWVGNENGGNHEQLNSIVEKRLNDLGYK